MVRYDQPNHSTLFLYQHRFFQVQVLPKPSKASKGTGRRGGGFSERGTRLFAEVRDLRKSGIPSRDDPCKDFLTQIRGNSLWACEFQPSGLRFCFLRRRSSNQEPCSIRHRHRARLRCVVCRIRHRFPRRIPRQPRRKLAAHVSPPSSDSKIPSP